MREPGREEEERRDEVHSRSHHYCSPRSRTHVTQHTTHTLRASTTTALRASTTTALRAHGLTSPHTLHLHHYCSPRSRTSPHTHTPR